MIAHDEDQLTVETCDRLDLLHPRADHGDLRGYRRPLLPHYPRVLAHRREIESIASEDYRLESAFLGEPADGLDERTMGRAGRLAWAIMLVGAAADDPVVDLELIRADVEGPARSSNRRWIERNKGARHQAAFRSGSGLAVTENSPWNLAAAAR